MSNENTIEASIEKRTLRNLQIEIERERIFFTLIEELRPRVFERLIELYASGKVQLREEDRGRVAHPVSLFGGLLRFWVHPRRERLFWHLTPPVSGNNRSIQWALLEDGTIGMMKWSIRRYEPNISGNKSHPVERGIFENEAFYSIISQRPFTASAMENAYAFLRLFAVNTLQFDRGPLEKRENELLRGYEIGTIGSQSASLESPMPYTEPIHPGVHWFNLNRIGFSADLFRPRRPQ